MRRLATYMITKDEPETLVAAVERAIAAGVERVQIRLPGVAGRNVERIVGSLVARDTGLRKRLIVNDRLDVALAMGLAGVHLPRNGLLPADVRRHVPEGFVIGVSTHRVEEVMEAGRGGADFVVFGPIFETNSKPGHKGVGLAQLERAVAQTSVPVYALGGIAPKHLVGVAETGAAGVAGISMFSSEAALGELSSWLS